MTNPGLRIDVSKEEFLAKSQAERDWILYEAINMINQHGCQWGRTHWKKVFTFGGFLGLAGGFLAQIFRRWFQV